MPPAASLLNIATIRRLWSHLVIRNVVMLYVLQLSTYLLPLLVLPYLSRVLSPEKYGTIAFAQFFMYYFLILSEYGFGLTATRNIAVNSHDLPAVSRIFSNVMAARVMLMAVGFVIMMGVVFATPKMRVNWPIFPIAFLGVVGNVLFPQWLFQGLQKMQHIVLRDLIAKTLSLIAIFIFVHSDKDYLLAAGLQSAGMVVAGSISLIIMPRVTGVHFLRPEWAGVWTELKHGWPVFLSLAANTTYNSTNTFLLGLVAAPAMVAYYSNAYRLIVAIRGLVSPLVTAIYPYISRMAAGSGEDAVRFIRRYAFVITAPFLAVSVGLLAGAPLLVKILFGPKYVYTGVLLQVMSASPFLYAISHCYCTYFMLAFGYNREWSRLILRSAVVNFVVLGPLLYLITPAMALAITGIVIDLFVAVSAYFFYRKHAGEAEHSTAAGPLQSEVIPSVSE
ncbi:MAG TPA: oligosaccharide flippase family protein [Bryobacteraceae bacterium]|nr:oligosaccharide flippase family protein [Bryobacteraceae bacterium]